MTIAKLRDAVFVRLGSYGVDLIALFLRLRLSLGARIWIGAEKYGSDKLVIRH